MKEGARGGIVMPSIGILLVLAFSLSCGQQQAQQPVQKAASTSAPLQWTATAIPDLEMAVISGDPAGKGPVVVRLRANRQLSLPSHSYPTDEKLTVLAGSASIGPADKSTTPRQLKQGEHIVVPKDSRQIATFEAGTEVELQGDGPFVTHWENPAAVKALKKSDVESLSDRTKMKKEQDKN